MRVRVEGVMILAVCLLAAVALLSSALLAEAGDVRDQLLRNGPRDSSGKPEYGIALASSMVKISPRRPELARLESSSRIVL